MTVLIFNDTDFEYQWFSGTGAGGQHRNKHQNCLRLVHKETGIKVIAQSFKTRQRNKQLALEQMRIRLFEHYNQREVPIRPDHLVRTYKLDDGRFINHMTGKKFFETLLNDGAFAEMLEDNTLNSIEKSNQGKNDV